MPAPNIATLYDFESAYEDALAAYFANVNIGGQTFAQVITPRTNINTAAELKTPRLQIRVGMTGLAATGGGVQEELATINAVPNVAYYAYYEFNLSLGVVSSRSNTSQPHGLFRGGVRQGMLEATAIMNNTTVPYYQTPFVNPLSSVQGINAENDEITTELGYGFTCFIPPASFP